MEAKHRPIEIVLGWGISGWGILCVIGRVWHVLSVPLIDPMTSIIYLFVCNVIKYLAERSMPKYLDERSMLIKEMHTRSPAKIKVM